MLRAADTVMHGTVNTKDAADEFIKLRHLRRRKSALDFYPMLDAKVSHAPNPKARQYALEVSSRYDDFFGNRSIKT